MIQAAILMAVIGVGLIGAVYAGIRSIKIEDLEYPGE